MTKLQIPINDQFPMTNVQAETSKFDLTERTACFGEAVIGFAKKIVVTPLTRSLIDQMARAATSVGANYCEADDAESKKDFRHKISVCLKEIKETKHWLRMMVAAAPEFRDEAATLWKEAKELNLIFAKIKQSSS